MLLVRGRFAEDIEAIKQHLGETGETVKSFEDTTADYRYRLVCTRASLAKVVADLITAIDYPNFKSAVHGNCTRDLAYMRCWSAMNDAQAQP